MFSNGFVALAYDLSIAMVLAYTVFYGPNFALVSRYYASDRDC